jgi:hypothetical protein
MTWSSLIANKGSPGSIANYLSYAKLVTEVPTILDEAQGLLYTLLRCREMRTKTRFTLTPGAANTPLPQNFLDPIGRMMAFDYDWPFDHRDESYVQEARNWNTTSGVLGTDPFTVTNGSTQVSVSLPGHGFNQESAFYTTGATVLNGVTIAGTFDILSITDANDFVIDITPLGVVPTSSGSGGGSAVNYTCNNLVAGTPLFWAIWDEAIHFDQAFTVQLTCELLFFQSLPLLSSTNQSNFLTNRYPHLIRPACQARAAAYMRDDVSFQRELTILTGMVQSISAENDMMYRGADIMTENPQ